MTQCHAIAMRRLHRNGTGARNAALQKEFTALTKCCRRLILT